MNDLKKPPVILIAEDDPDDQLMLKEAFAERCLSYQLCFVQDGVQLMHVLNGKEQLSDDPEAACSDPNLILLDLNMPLKDGREALKDIKSDPRLRIIPTVVMTTSASEDDIAFCYGTGANSYIVKPSSYSGLLDVVSSLSAYWSNTVTLPKKLERHDQE